MAMNWAMEPLTNKPSIYARQAADVIDKPRQGSQRFDPNSFLGGAEELGNWGNAVARGGMAGATEGLGDLASGMTSPLSLAASIIGAPWMGRLTTGAKAAASGMGALSKTAPVTSGIAPSMLPAELVSQGAESIYNTARSMPRITKTVEDLAYEVVRNNNKMGLGKNLVLDNMQRVQAARGR